MAFPGLVNNQRLCASSVPALLSHRYLGSASGSLSSQPQEGCHTHHTDGNVQRKGHSSCVSLVRETTPCASLASITSPLHD